MAPPTGDVHAWCRVTERELQRAVEILARLCRWLVYHTYDSRRSQAGFPDLVMIRGHRMIAAELKSQKGELRPEQQQWMAAFDGVPFVESYVWRPSDMETIRSILV